MNIKGRILALVLMALTIQACQADGMGRKINIGDRSSGEELVLKNRVSLPLPDRYEKIGFDENFIIVTAPEFSVAYPWID